MSARCPRCSQDPGECRCTQLQIRPDAHPLFPGLQAVDPGDPSLDDWCAFHDQNPHVYRELVALCRRAEERGVPQWSINGIFEVLRWERALKTSGEVFKLNNNHRAFYARAIMRDEPGLADFFEVRRSSADEYFA